MKPLKTAAAEPVCGQNLQLLGSMGARHVADAGRRAVCGQRVPGSAPDLHNGTVLLQQSPSRKKSGFKAFEPPSRPDSVGDSESLCEFIDILGMDFSY